MILTLSLELKIISNSVSTPQIRQDYAPFQQQIARAVITPFPQRVGENWNRNGTKTDPLPSLWFTSQPATFLSFSFCTCSSSRLRNSKQKGAGRDCNQGPWRPSQHGYPPPQPLYLQKDFSQRTILMREVGKNAEIKEKNQAIRNNNTLTIKQIKDL